MNISKRMIDVDKSVKMMINDNNDDDENTISEMTLAQLINITTAFRHQHFLLKFTSMWSSLSLGNAVLSPSKFRFG